MPSNAYNPTAEQPYQAYQPPPIAPPPPSPVAPANPPFQFTGAPNTKLGNIAGSLDNLFRGYMQGKAQRAANITQQFQAKSDNLRASYEQDAQRLFALSQAGTDPSSDEYKMAVSAVNGSWGALQDWREKIVNGPDGDKPKKSKKKTDQSAQQPPNPQQQLQQVMQDLQSPDPQVKAAAALKIQQKLGAPVMWQVKQFYTPEAIAARQTQQQAAQNSVTAAGQQGQQLTHQQTQLDAQAKIDELNKTPRDQWTPAMQQQYEQAAQIVTPVEAEKPGQQAQLAVDALVRKKMENPSYEFTESDRQIFRAAKIDIDPKQKIHVTSRGEIIAEGDDGQFQVLRGPQAAYEPRGGSGRGGAGSGADKTYKKWDDYYKEHYPDMSADEREALVKRKVEGTGQVQAGVLAHDAVAEPKQFDNDLLTAAIDKLRALPQWKLLDSGKTDENGRTPFDNALANLVGIGSDGYQYHAKSDLGKPDRSGKYSGDVTADQLKMMERDLQTQIRTILTGSKETALSPEARRAVVGRMQPLFGPAAPAGRTGTTQSPESGATPTGAASSPPSAGGKPSKGIVKKSAFLKENPGATDADWQAVKLQLTPQGYDVKDE